jgi:hypothetical protein
MTKHTCTADCWAYLIRNGEDENTTDCDVFAARAAAAARLSEYSVD